MISENTAKFSGGSYLKMHWEEVIHPKPEETRTAEEIIGAIKSKLAKLGGDNHGSV